MKKTLTILLAALLVSGSAYIVPTVSAEDDMLVSPAPVEEQHPAFLDVAAGSTLEAALIRLRDAGIINGYEDGSFRPANGLTRGEFCKMVNKLFGYTEKASENFPDIDKEADWFYDEVLIAKQQGYINGFEDGTFRGREQVTREQVCVILDRINNFYNLYPVEIADTVSDWSRDSVEAVISNGFMPLEDGNTFRATQIITREEFAYVFIPFLTAMEETEPDEEKTESNGNTGSSNTGSGNTGSGTTGSGTTGSGTTGSGTTGSGTTGSGTTGSGTTGSGTTGSGSTGSGNTGSGTTGSGTTGSGSTGSGNTGSGSTGSGNTGSGNTDTDGGNTGESGDDTEPEIDLTVDDVVIEEMQKLKDDFDKAFRSLSTHEKSELKQVRDTISGVIGSIISDSETTLITPEYVTENYAEEMAQVEDDYYNLLCDDCRARFNTFVVDNSSNYKTVLVEYFYDLIPEEAFEIIGES